MCGDDFTVDIAGLRALLTRMERCEDELEALTNDVEREVARLQGTWVGEAAEAQALAHEEWEEGLALMRACALELRTKMDTSCGNYQAAVDTNLAMWQAVVS